MDNRVQQCRFTEIHTTDFHSKICFLTSTNESTTHSTWWWHDNYVTGLPCPPHHSPFLFQSELFPSWWCRDNYVTGLLCPPLCPYLPIRGLVAYKSTPIKPSHFVNRHHTSLRFHCFLQSEIFWLTAVITHSGHVVSCDFFPCASWMFYPFFAVLGFT